MKIAISNIAWNKDENDLISQLLAKFGIAGVEVAPTKVWENPFSQSDREIKKYKDYWKNKDIEIVALCSLLYGHPELMIFDSPKQREATYQHLIQMMELGAKLGAKILVFGSPKNRLFTNVTQKKVDEIAFDFFTRVSSKAKLYKLFFCIEPNPVQYGTNFINTSLEAVKFVKKINQPNFWVHLDSSTIALNDEDYLKTLTVAKDYTKHFHISEDYLKEIGTGKVDHAKFAQVLKGVNYSNWASIEMPAAIDVGNVKRVERVLKFVVSKYS